MDADITAIIVALISGFFALLIKIVDLMVQRSSKKSGKLKKDSSITKLLLIVSLIVFAISIVLVVLSFNGPTSALVQLTYPHNGDGVDLVFSVEGTSQNVPENQAIWVIVYPHEVGLYYPMADCAVTHANGAWTSVAYLGEENDTGKQFDIFAVVANQTAQDELNAYATICKITGSYSGMGALPVGTVVYDKVTVIRNPSTVTPTPSVSSQTSSPHVTSPSPSTSSTVTSPPPASPLPSAKITYPLDGSTIGRNVTVQGTSQNLPGEQVIWVIVYVHSVNLYYPMSECAVTQTNGNWECFTTLGIQNDTGTKFDIIAVFANQTAQQTISNYLIEAKNRQSYPGLEGLPLGTSVQDKITITRDVW